MIKLISSSLVFFLALLITSCHTHKHPEGNYVSADGGYFAAYSLVDAKYGTKTIVTIENGTRKMSTNALPNHATGAFPNAGNPNTISAQDRTYEFPLKPKYTGEAKWARQPALP